MAGIQAGLAPTHTGLQTLVVASLAEEVDAYRTWQATQRVDGVILIDPRRDDERVALVAELGLPAVQIGSHPSLDPTVPTVWVDDHEVATRLFDAMFALGHRRVGYVMGPLDLEHTELRRQAFHDCVGRYDAGTPVSVETDYSAEQSAAATLDLLRRDDRPSALVYDNDVMALAGLRVAQEEGVTVPRELSIASFDDSIAMRLVRPSITALTRDTYALGEARCADADAGGHGCGVRGDGRVCRGDDADAVGAGEHGAVARRAGVTCRRPVLRRRL